MRPDEAGALAKKAVAPPWDDIRAARVHRKVVAAAAAARVAAANPAPVRSASRARLVTVVAAALALAAAVALFVLRDRWAGGPDPTAGSRLELPDGSLVTLSTSPDAVPARVVPKLVSRERVEVEQLTGVATYAVAKVPDRTFVVHCDDVKVEVIGTSFRIEKKERAVRVTVIEGHVRVGRGERSVELLAGDDLTFGPPAEPTPPDPRPVADEQPPPSPSGSARPEPPAPSASSPAITTAAKLFRNADDARAAGDLEGALKHLRTLVTEHPQDARVPLAHFTIGRIELQRGKAEAAASAFERSGFAMNGEGIAEAALARSSLGQADAARALAGRYLERFPTGPRASEMKTLAQ